MILGELLQRSNVVKYIDSAPEGRDHQIVKLFLHHGPGQWRVSQGSIQRPPVSSAIQRVEESVARARKQQAPAVRVLSDGADVRQGVFREISSDRLPRFTEVARLVYKRITIVHEVKINADVRRGGIERRRRDASYRAPRRQPRKALRDVDPICRAVFRVPHLTIIRSCPDQSFLDLGGSNREDDFSIKLSEVISDDSSRRNNVARILGR